MLIKAFSLLVALVATGSAAQDKPAVTPPSWSARAGPSTSDLVRFRSDAADRITVPIAINGDGPHSFIVDTGAERSAISSELAAKLGLSPGEDLLVTSFGGSAKVGTVVIPRMRFSRSSYSDLRALVFSRYAIGADGFLGIDSLAHQQVLFDFDDNRMTIKPAPRIGARSEVGSIVVPATKHRGRLVITNAIVDGIRVQVVIDTGSGMSIGNEAMRRALFKRRRLGHTTPIDMLAVTGEVIHADYGFVGEISFGDVRIHDLPLAFSTVQPFEQIGFVDQPAMLMGMDALRAFGQVTIDFANKRVSFKAHESAVQGRIRLASHPRPLVKIAKLVSPAGFEPATY